MNCDIGSTLLLFTVNFLWNYKHLSIIIDIGDRCVESFNLQEFISVKF